MRHEVSIEIDRPIEAVFDYTNNHVPEWSITVVAEERHGDTPGVGATFRCMTEDHGRKMDFDGVVTLWEPPRTSAVTLTGKHFDIEARYDFEDLGGRTRVTQRSKIRPKGFTKVFLALFGRFMQKSADKAARREFDSLKRHLESRSA